MSRSYTNSKARTKWTSAYVAAAFASVLAACGDDGTTQTEAKWQLLAEHTPSSLLAVWASSPENVWVVGGREGTGGAPAVWHYDGAAWAKMETGEVNVDLWQVFGFEDGTVFLGGSNGTILRYRDGAFTKIQTPSTFTVFGLWGTSSNDVWAVGGQGSSKGFAWRYQGTSFETVAGVPTELETMGTVWKVTGRSASDVWMSCSRGMVLHWDGGAISSERIGTEGESLFSMGCSEKRCVTAGTNLANGVLYENEGAAWANAVPTEDGPIWRGVTPTGEHQFVVGTVGTVIRDVEGAWVSDPHGLTTETLHAAWADVDGNFFAVGGQFDRAITIEGVMLFKGTSTLPPLPL
jgi:hypothetical protein